MVSSSSLLCVCKSLCSSSKEADKAKHSHYVDACQDDAPPLAVLMVQSIAKSMGEDMVESTLKAGTGSVTVRGNDRIAASSKMAGEGGSEGVEPDGGGGNSKGSESIGEEEDEGGQNKSVGEATFVVGLVSSTGKSTDAPSGHLSSTVGDVSIVTVEGLL